jgi:hypothetical protein
MENVHWILFAIVPTNLDILVFDLLFDPARCYHVKIYRIILHFIPTISNLSPHQDQWAWHVHHITSKKQVKTDDCGVCMSLAIYFLVHG